MNSWSFNNPKILKDGTACGTECHNSTTLEEDTIKFNVTSWSNYTIGDDSSAPTVTTYYEGEFTPVVSSTKDITFTFNVTDANGVENINGSTARASFNYTGETTKTNNSCVWAFNYTNENKAEFECTITMQHYDIAGNWTINASITDKDELYADNIATSIKYNMLYSLDFSDINQGINWSSISVSGSDTEADDNPYSLTNEGNADNISINITAYNLVGVDTPTHIIPATHQEEEQQ